MRSRLWSASLVMAALAAVVLYPFTHHLPAALNRSAMRTIPVAQTVSTVTPAAWVTVTPSSSLGVSPGNSAVSAKVPPRTTPIPSSFVPPAGTLFVPHVVQRGESVPGIVSQYLAESVYMRRAELEDAIRTANGLTGVYPKPGTELQIPGIPEHPIVDKPIPVPKGFVARGIYLTAYSAGSNSGLDLMKRWKDAGGNTVVFDFKDYDGIVHVPYQHAYSQSDQITVRNPAKLIHYIHGLHLHAIVRIAVFRDARLVTAFPQFAAQSHATGRPWSENGKVVWTDPSNPEVQQYDLDLAKLAANAGADEVQFDYVRFPAEGDQSDVRFAYQKDHPDWPRSKVITDFVGRAHQMLHAQGVLFSIDVFGVMAWARPVDLSHTGQNIADLARQVDVMSPMIYPSHFYGFDGYQLPGDAPEHFISESMERFEETTKGTSVILRPWLQAFGWRTKTYSAEYILTQVRVSHQRGGMGFMLWSATNDYSKPFDAMPRLEAALNAPLLPPETREPTKKPISPEKAKSADKPANTEKSSREGHALGATN